jgi:virginiamycin B lyase
MTRPTQQPARSFPTIHIGLLALLAALLVLPLTLAPRAEAFVYWNGYGTIERANLDGSGIEPSFITTVGGSGGALAVGERHIYWAEGYTGAIERANLDGTGVDHSFITGADTGSVAVDAAHVYWSNASTTPEDPYDPTIVRANLDGSDKTSFDIGPSYGAGLAVDSAHIYWTDNYSGCAIERANLDGTGVEQGFIPLPGCSPGTLSGLAVDAEHIYWTTFTNTGTIGRANLDGSGVERSFITEASFPADVAVDAAHVYWSGSAFGTIGRANLDGSGVEHSFITGVGLPGSIAVNFSVGKPRKNKERGTAQLTVEVPAPGTVALAETTKVRGAEVRAEAAGEVQLAIKPRGKAKKKLAQHGKAKVAVEIPYTPDGGEPEKQTMTLKLVKRS